MSSAAAARIQKDLIEVNKNPNIQQPPICCLPREDQDTGAEDLYHMDALIMGPPDTPYEYGFYTFDMTFNDSYPSKPPKCLITSTDGGRTRFNPNLYAGGKVCLSILGTWSGESADEWRPSYGIRYLLEAIQTLIMNEAPYHNEPGYEKNETSSSHNSGRGNASEVSTYNEKVTHENLRIAVCNAVEKILEDPNSSPFASLIRTQFLLRYENYLRRAEEGLAKNIDGTAFAHMPFEYGSNGMDGKFDYASIKQRLITLKDKLVAERQLWIEQGRENTAKLVDSFHAGASCLRREYQLLKDDSPEGISASPINPNNLFHWNAMIFGPERSVWNDATYNVEIVFPPNFPNEEPLIIFTSKMFHPSITVDGIPYILNSVGTRISVKNTLLGILQILKDPFNNSPCAWVNAEAARLCFSKSEADQREFKRRIRRCKEVE